MLKKIKSLWGWLIHIGVDEQTPAALLERVIFSNMVYVVSFGIYSLADLADIAHGHWLLIAGNMWLTVVNIFCFWLNSRRHYVASRATFMIAIGVTVAIEAASVGPHIPNHGYLLPFLALSSLMFIASERRLSLLIAIGYSVAYFVVDNLPGAAFRFDNSTFTESDRYTVQVLFLAGLVIATRALAIANDNANVALKAAYAEIKANQVLIQSMLNSINEAFLIFDADGVCMRNASTASLSLLGFDPFQKHISEVLDPEGKDRQSVKDWFELLVMERLDFGDMAILGMKQMETNGGKTILKLAFHPMREDTGKLKAVIMTATEVTKEVMAQRQAEQERLRAEMILGIVDNKSFVRPFLNDFEKFISETRQWNGAELEKIQHELHSFKGTALFLRVSNLANQIYEMELKIREYQGSDLKAHVREAARTLRKGFVAWQDKELNLLTELGVFDDDNIEIPLRRIDEMKTSVARVNDSNVRTALTSILDGLTNNELGDLLSAFEMHVIHTAKKLDKKVAFKVIRPSDGISLPRKAYRTALRSLVHVLNNAVDHGIETPAEREAMRKPPQGTISIRYERLTQDQKNWIRLLIEDDGKGIDIAKLRQKLHQKNRLTDATKPDLELAMHIFDDGVSTRDSYSMLSGQGVGMGAVREEVLKAEGKIRITKTGGSGTTFELLLPDVSVASTGDQFLPKVG